MFGMKRHFLREREITNLGLQNPNTHFVFIPFVKERRFSPAGLKRKSFAIESFGVESHCHSVSNSVSECFREASVSSGLIRRHEIEQYQRGASGHFDSFNLVTYSKSPS